LANFNAYWQLIIRVLVNESNQKSRISNCGARYPFPSRYQGLCKRDAAVVDKPLIQYAVEEAYAAGIRHMIFVTGRTKRSVETTLILPTNWRMNLSWLARPSS